MLCYAYAMTSGSSALSAAGGLGGGLLSAAEPLGSPFDAASFFTSVAVLFVTAFFWPVLVDLNEKHTCRLRVTLKFKQNGTEKQDK